VSGHRGFSTFGGRGDLSGSERAKGRRGSIGFFPLKPKGGDLRSLRKDNSEERKSRTLDVSRGRMAADLSIEVTLEMHWPGHKNKNRTLW